MEGESRWFVTAAERGKQHDRGELIIEKCAKITHMNIQYKVVFFVSIYPYTLPDSMLHTHYHRSQSYKGKL